MSEPAPPPDSALSGSQPPGPQPPGSQSPGPDSPGPSCDPPSGSAAPDPPSGSLPRRLLDGLTHRIELLRDARYPAEPVALFRIAGSLVALADVLATWNYAALFWGTWHHVGLIDAAYGAWSVVLVLLALGYRTPIMAVANYLLTFPLILHLDYTFEYHFDYYLRTWSFFLMFMHSGRAYSLDSLLARRRAAIRGGAARILRTVPKWIIILFVLQFSLDYFDAGFRKFDDRPMWDNGFGLYWPMLGRYCSTGNGLWLLDLEWVLIPLSYFTVALEVAFPLLMLWRPARYLAILGGLGLHIGIIYLLPIDFFGEFMLALYALFLPLSWIRRVERLLAPITDRLRSLATRMGWPPAIPDSAYEPPTPPSPVARFRPHIFLVAAGLILVTKLGHVGYLVPQSVAQPMAASAKTLYSYVPHFVFMSFHFQHNGVMEVFLETPDGELEHFPLMTRDGFPGRISQESTRAWILVIRVSKASNPKSLLGRKFIPWLDVTQRHACAVHIWRRWIRPPRTFEGKVDLWTDAPREYLGRWQLRRSPARCPAPAGDPPR